MKKNLLCIPAVPAAVPDVPDAGLKGAALHFLLVILPLLHYTGK